MSFKSLALIFLLSTGLTALSAAEPVTLEKSVPVSGKKADKSKFAGRIVSYDEEGFELRVKADETATIPWSELDTKTHYVVRKSLLDPKDAPAHVELGKTLLALDGGKEWAEKAFALAVKIDPAVKPAIEEARKTPTTKASSNKKDDEAAKTDKPGMESETKDAGGPKMVGGVDKSFWGPLTEQQQADAVELLKKFAGETQKQMKKELSLYETNFFLFYSDLDKKEAKNWAGVLDKMYGLLADLFGTDRKSNIFRGKALVFVFRDASDYRRFQMTMHNTDPGPTIGMCHGYGDGMVHIAFFRQKDELEFLHVLVHESVHGFLHRYKSPVNVPSWANEGLADWISGRFVGEEEKRLFNQTRREKKIRYNAQGWLQQYRGVGDLFEAEHITGWQYPVAEMLTTFMISENKKSYVAFINGIKDGLTWEESFRRAGAAREKLLPLFGQWIGVKIDG